MERFYLKFNNLFFWLILGLLVFIPLYPKFPLVNVNGTYVAIRFEDLLIGLVEGLWLIANFSKLKKIFSMPLTQAFLVFWLIGFISLLSGIFITFTVAPSLGLFHFLRRIELMGLFFVAATAFKNTKQVKLALQVMLVTALLVVFYGLGQVYFKFPVVSTNNSEFSKGLVLVLTLGARPNSTFAGHYDLAIYLSVVLVFLASFLFFGKRLLLKIILFITGLLSFGLLGLTAARASWLASLVGIALVFCVMGKRILIVGLILASTIAVVAIPSLRHRLVATLTVNVLEGGGPKYTPPSPSPINKLTASSSATATTAAQTNLPIDIAPGEPLNVTELDVYRSYNIRTQVEWPRAIAAFVKNPLLGTGYSSLTLATDNDILRSIGETGLLGTLGLSLILFIILKVLISKLKSKQGLEQLFIIATICSLCAIFISMIFLDVLEASKIATLFWILLGIAWVVANDYQYDK